MVKSSFKESPKTLVSICKHLLDGSPLHWVHHLPAEKDVWHLMCIEQHETTDMKKITLEEALGLFPEFNELSDIPQEMDVSFKRGKNSGKWYDFHRGD